METSKRHSLRRTLVLLATSLTIALWPAMSHEIQSPTVDQSKVPPPESYAGTEVCASCHQKQAHSYSTTPHARDSSLPNAKTIVGDFTPERAVLRTSNPNLAFVMAASPDGFFQAAVNPSNPQSAKPDLRSIDIVVGSGRHGQTYLHWEEDRLFELPVSYWTYDDRWVNSPGYPDGQLHWDRAVLPRCLECHVSYFSWLPPASNRYSKTSLVLGIDCERCHGPGALHTARERSPHPPQRGSAELAIVNPAHLSHDQQLSLCSLCHSGGAAAHATPMTFVVGDDIRDYLKITPPPLEAPVDVHGNQVGALQQSKCYGSGKLTCSTCHDVHETQEDAAAFSSHCLTCHQVRACGRYRTLGASIRNRCVECHMPVQNSKSVTTANAGQQVNASMRAHRIAIYPETALAAPSQPHQLPAEK
jgi:hypothetical protein